MKQAIIYARHSPRRNADQCESVETQIELCQDFCKKNNYRISGIFFDKNMSGGDENRAGLWDAIEQLKRGYMLIVNRLDRLARGVYLSHIIEQAIKKQKATIVSILGEGTWDDTAESKLIRDILIALAEYERKVIAARTKAAMLRQQANGKLVSSNPPLGFSVDPVAPDKIIPNTQEQAAISKIMELYEEYSIEAIARELDAGGYKPRGKKWHSTTIKRFLKRNNIGKTDHS